MLIVKLGDHDMILGRKWFAATGVLIDCRNRKLVWPQDRPRDTGWARILTTTRKNLEHNIKKEHQTDADRRDKLIAVAETRRPRILQRDPARARTWRADQIDQYQKMSVELSRDHEQAQKLPPTKTRQTMKK
jgi:hypothetical protein